ncbi:hypothetical protein FA15DRAFT_552050, partial [Coprinopsis marcescibilis]
MFASADHPQFRTHGVKMRRESVVPVLLGPNLSLKGNTPEELEIWSMEMLTLFKPWRTPGDLKREGQKWIDAYSEFEPSIGLECRNVMSNMALLGEARRVRST